MVNQPSPSLVRRPSPVLLEILRSNVADIEKNAADPAAENLKKMLVRWIGDLERNAVVDDILQCVK
jgi:hypothetical protein